LNENVINEEAALEICSEWINIMKIFMFENNCVVCMNVKATITTKVVKQKNDEAAKSSTNILIGQSALTNAPSHRLAVTCRE
jgi:hypothetical protein